MSSPIVYEIDTRGWLAALTGREGKAIDLANVPAAEFTRWQRLGFTHLWLMGVWTTGPRSRAHALNDPQLRRRYDEILPGWRDSDVAGSPYAIAAYEVPAALGGEAGLARFRARLNVAGLRLILDFVPNHVGLDHPWVTSRPELFVSGPPNEPGTFAQDTSRGIAWLAHGRDPYFEPWVDVVQLDYRLAGTRAAMVEVLGSVARRCDGVRCDMAMLMLSDVFAKTWERFPADDGASAGEFWAEAISKVKQQAPELLLLAEAYWGLEPRLLELGFDYVYDKTVYDCLLNRQYEELQRRLRDDNATWLARGTHFLENHDERRVAGSLSPSEHRAAALTILGLPGMRLFFDGQLEGARIQTPVQLARRPAEAPDAQIVRLYEELLVTLHQTALGQGHGRLLRAEAALPENPAADKFIIVQWQKSPPEFDLLVVNPAPQRGPCRVKLQIDGLKGRQWVLRDRLGDEMLERDGDEMVTRGLWLDLPEHGVKLFHGAAG